MLVGLYLAGLRGLSPGNQALSLKPWSMVGVLVTLMELADVFWTSDQDVSWVPPKLGVSGMP